MGRPANRDREHSRPSRWRRERRHHRQPAASNRLRRRRGPAHGHNTDLAVVQRGDLWSSDGAYDAPSTPTVTSHDLGLGADLGVAIEIATPITDDVLSFLRDRDLPAGRLVATPSGGPRDNAVRGPADACALAVGIRDAVRREVRGYSRVPLFLAGPMGLALLLGHRWTGSHQQLSTKTYKPQATKPPSPSRRNSAAAAAPHRE
ncbi:SAVED domain-containing protein [Actinophytocola sp.]|uniref:SAVED domain-containing protein n=1 Tax=Actinophytocola sp. TaxID=1872138 RepID=UPI0039C8A9B3